MKKLRQIALSASALSLAVVPALAQSYYYTSSNSADAGVGLFIYCCICLIALPLIILQIYLIVDSFRRDYGSNSSMQVVGLLLLLIIGFPIGTLLYYFLIMQKFPKKS